MFRPTLLVVAMLLAGCSDGAGDEAPQAPGGPDLDGPDGATQQSGGGGKGTGDNRVPLLTFAADVVRGDGPLTATFTIKGHDDDGDALSWRADLDGDGNDDDQGDGPNGTTQFTYRVQGTYHAQAWVSDGTDEAAAMISIEVLSSEPVQTEEADLLLQVEGCFVPAAYEAAGVVPGATGSPASGLSRLVFEVHADSIGRPFTAEWTFDQGYLSMAWFFADAGGDVVASSVDTEPNFGNYRQTGTVPAGAAYGILFGCGGPAMAHVEYVA